MRRLDRWIVLGTCALVLGGCAERASRPAERNAAAPPPAEAAANAPTPPPPGTPLAKITKGMAMSDVAQILGQPTDQNQYVTGKAFIPFYYGGDSTRFAAYWKGQGRVIFQGGNAWGAGRGKVVRVEYDPSEDGYADTK